VILTQDSLNACQFFSITYVPTGEVPVENANKYLHSSLFFPIPFVSYLLSSFPIPFISILSFLYMKTYQENIAQNYCYR
jgi:hypothetical protein